MTRAIPCTWYESAVAVFLSLCCMSRALAGPISPFFAADMGATSLATMPLSVGASTLWNSAAGALGPIQLIDFESPYPTGPRTSVSLAPGVTLSTNAGTFEISNAPAGFLGSVFDTTPGGSFYAGLSPCGSPLLLCFSSAIYTFSFNNPIQAFGLYITGRGQRRLFDPNPVQGLFFNDPTFQSGPLPYADGVTGQFVGFTDAGASISSVSLVVGGSSFPNVVDSFAFDDVRWVPTIPEPATVALLGLGLAGLMAARRCEPNRRATPSRIDLARVRAVGDRC